MGLTASRPFPLYSTLDCRTDGLPCISPECFIQHAERGRPIGLSFTFFLCLWAQSVGNKDGPEYKCDICPTIRWMALMGEVYVARRREKKEKRVEFLDVSLFNPPPLPSSPCPFPPQFFFVLGVTGGRLNRWILVVLVRNGIPQDLLTDRKLHWEGGREKKKKLQAKRKSEIKREGRVR